MEVQDKYLPVKEDRAAFLQTRINEYKKQVFGGIIEIDTAVNHSSDEAVQEHTRREQEYQIKQHIKDIDYYTQELANLVK